MSTDKGGNIFPTVVSIMLTRFNERANVKSHLDFDVDTQDKEDRQDRKGQNEE